MKAKEEDITGAGMLGKNITAIRLVARLQSLRL